MTPDDDKRSALIDAAAEAAIDPSGFGAAAVLGAVAERAPASIPEAVPLDLGPTALATSLDAKWACVKHGTRLTVLDAAGARVAERDLPDADADLVFAGLPTVLCAVVRGAQPQLVMYVGPDWVEVARLVLGQPLYHAATTGPRFVLRSADSAQLHLVRTLGRGLGAKPVDLASLGGRPAGVVGLANDQLLFEVGDILQVWDASVPKPLHRLQVQLPPGPRMIGAAAGHVWVARGDEVFVYRLSDKRPFRHSVGVRVDAVISHPASPVVVIVTSQGLARLSCFAHAMTLVESPWQPGAALALQPASADDVTLLGCAASDALPWRVAVGKPPTT